MLIRAVRAENFMRYSRLEISGLPQRGIVGIEGPNESGKSTIGEVLLFAFFGRTRLSAESSLTGLIRWGADSMSAEVEFTIRGAAAPGGNEREADGDYLIFRQIDRYGTNYVKILELPDRREAATGNLKVAEFIAKRVRFGFHEFQHSFYHDQHAERRAQSSQAAFFECAAGMKHLRLAMDQLRREAEPMERELAYYQREIARNLGQIEKYDRNVVKIPDLAARAAKHADAIAEQLKKVAESRRRADALRAEAAVLETRAKRIEQLPDASIDAFGAQVEKILGADPGASREGLESVRAFVAEAGSLASLVQIERQAAVKRLDPTSEGTPAAEKAKLEAQLTKLARRASRRVAAAVGGLVTGLLIAVAAWGAFAYEWKAPEVWHDALRESFRWQIVGTAAFVFLVGVLCLWSARRLKRKRASLAAACSELDGQIATSRTDSTALAALAAVERLKDLPRFAAQAAACACEPVAQAASRIRTQHGALVEPGDATGLERHLGAFAKVARDQRSRLLSEAQRLDKAAQEDDASAKKLAGEKERVDAEVRECQSQASKKEALEAKNRDLQASSAGVRSGIDLQLLAIRLLEDAVASIRSRIGPALTRFVKSVLPRLTAGRYRDVRVENDLQIKVFSSEKNDFLSLHELSGGTSEALCLALRLAISHAFTAARTRQSQFVFLDEPFKMMDAARAAETLRILPRLSPGLEQFFIAQPSFSSEGRELLDVLIRTSPGTASLEAVCSPPRNLVEGGSGNGGDLARVEGPDSSAHVVEA